ncbi:MAG: thermonuclease family protein [Eggerthellaceae bacterium]|nr:thermonuclease family protein [Eggerthellaceae bacterium]
MERNVSSRPSGFWGLFATFAVAVCTLSGVLAGCAADDYASVFATSGDGAQAGVPDGFEEAEVVRVVDGDTLQVYLNGEKQKVRLIGINCPESVATDESRNTAEGRDASGFTHELLSEGDVVWLQSDVNDTDQYDRLLRYVWIEAPANPYNEDEVAAKMLNAILVAEGFAEARVYGADDLYADVLDDLEREAVANERGVSYMWA